MIPSLSARGDYFLGSMREFTRRYVFGLLASEFFATFLLSTAQYVGQLHIEDQPEMVALSVAMASGLIYCILGRYGPIHMNPTVTYVAWRMGKFDSLLGLFFVGVQAVAAFLSYTFVLHVVGMPTLRPQPVLHPLGIDKVLFFQLFSIHFGQSFGTSFFFSSIYQNWLKFGDFSDVSPQRRRDRLTMAPLVLACAHGAAVFFQVPLNLSTMLAPICYKSMFDPGYFFVHDAHKTRITATVITHLTNTMTTPRFLRKSLKK